jgi:F-type H+-transporting ATPase subunit epsilon
MATFHFELVSPERLIFSGEVEQVDVPGAEGEFGVFAPACCGSMAGQVRRSA